MPDVHDMPPLVVPSAYAWLWRTLWALVERHRPLTSPWTFARLITCGLLIAVLIDTVPDLWLLVTWTHLATDQRALLSRVDRFLDGFAIVPFAVAWLLNFAGSHNVAAQLRRAPPLKPRWPGRRDVARLALILACVLAISAALTFAP